MGLKHFHLFFIACSLALMAVTYRWAAGQDAAAMTRVSIAGALLGFGYLGWFLKKYKTLG